MGKFNHRLIKHDSDESIGIYEVYYDDELKINGYRESCIVVGNDIDDLKREVANLNNAFDKPYLSMDKNGKIEDRNK